MSTLQAQDLHGSWLLSEWRIDYPAARPAGAKEAGSHLSTWPFGRDAIGLLTYSHDGWMSATMCWRARAPLSAASAMAADDASKARSYQEYLAYTGRWRLQGHSIVHDVEMSLNPTLIGTTQLREARIDGDVLALRATESQGAGPARVHQILWRRPT